MNSIVGAVLLASIPAALTVIVKLLHLLTTFQLTVSRRRPWAWAEGAALCVCVALLTYAFGAFSGVIDEGEFCAVKAGRDRPDSIVRNEFPLSTECRWSDGFSVELVPAWINPVLFACLAGVALCVAMAVRAAVEENKEFVHE